MNYLWGGMILVGVIYGALTGRMAEVTDQALLSAKEAVTLAITMIGVVAFWTGIMQIAENAGFIDRIAKLLSPVLKFLFPRIPKGHPALKQIATNMVANILGLGWAATPAGLCAMKELAKFDYQHLIPAADTGQHHCIPQPVRLGQSSLYRRTRHSCYLYQHNCGSNFL